MACQGRIISGWVVNTDKVYKNKRKEEKKKQTRTKIMDWRW
jgi:hypothetical protein